MNSGRRSSIAQFSGPLGLALASQLRHDGEETERLARGLAVKRPERRNGARYPNKPKYLDRVSTQDRLENAAVHARYEPSPYHCPLSNGQPPIRRAKPASHCPDGWTPRRALNCLREAIRARRVSRVWVGDFPRHVWHEDMSMWYEACTHSGTPGVYHAYPIEIIGLPPGLTP